YFTPTNSAISAARINRVTKTGPTSAIQCGRASTTSSSPSVSSRRGKAIGRDANSAVPLEQGLRPDVDHFAGGNRDPPLVGLQHEVSRRVDVERRALDHLSIPHGGLDAPAERGRDRRVRRDDQVREPVVAHRRIAFAEPPEELSEEGHPIDVTERGRALNPPGHRAEVQPDPHDNVLK